MNRKFNKRMLLVTYLVTFFVLSGQSITTFGIPNMKSESSLKNPTLSLENLEILGNAEFAEDNYTLLVEEWNKNIVLNPIYGIYVTEYYLFTNNLNSEHISTIYFSLAPNSKDIKVEDIYGQIPLNNIFISEYEEQIEVRVQLREHLEPMEHVKILVLYKLSKDNLSKKDFQSFLFNITLAKKGDWFVNNFSLKVTLPEGATFQSSSKIPTEIEKKGLIRSIIYSDQNVSHFDQTSVELEYQYVFLWTYFRPTLWIISSSSIIIILLYEKKLLKKETPEYPIVSSITIKDFVEVFEEERRLRSDLISLQQMVRRKKMSNRRYKIRKNSIDKRINRLNKSSTDLKKILLEAGRSFKDRIKKLNSAESEIEEANKEITRIETKFKLKEISRNSQKKLMSEQKRVKEKAENKIAEILLRLREDIS